MEKITKSSDKVLIDPNEPLILPDGTALVGRVEWFLYALCCLDYQNLPTPMSRIEEFANALITGEVPNIEPQSRAEQFFLAILDGNVSDLPQPQSRSEVLLDKLARGEFDLSDVEPIQSRYELLLAYLIKNGGIGNIDYVLYEFSEAMKTMYNTVEKPFKSLELSGNTLVNCVLEDTENDDYTSFDEDYSGTSFTINGTSEGAIKSAILKGNTERILVGKNIFDKTSKLYDGWLYQNGDYREDIGGTFYTTDFIKVKPNTDIVVNNGGGYAQYDDNKKCVYNVTYGSTTTLSNTKYIRVVVKKEVIDTLQIEYGTVSTDYEEPNYELQSVKMPVLTTTGKNLFDEKTFATSNEESKYYSWNNGQIQINAIDGRATPNAGFTYDYVLSFKKNDVITFSSNPALPLRITNLTTNTLMGSEIDGILTYTVPEDSILGFKIIGSTFPTNVNVQLEKGSVATSYEPYKSNILSCNEEVVLRGIGDVRDELDCLTDEIVQNIGEDVYNGYANEYWFYSGTIDNSIEFARSVLGVKRLLACDKLPISGTTERFVYASNKFYVRVLKDKLTTLNVEGFNEWLSNNPITVQYELETPIIKTVDLSIVDQNNTKIDKIHVFNETTHVNASSDELTPTINIGKSVSYPTIIKPNTKYTVDLKRNNKPLTVNLGGTEVTFASGETRKTITTPSTLTNDKLSYYGIGAKCNEIMLIEGEIERNIDYFTGMQSVEMQNQMPILTTVGKNLLNLNNYTIRYGVENLIKNDDSFTLDIIDGWGGIQFKDLKLKPNTNYTFKFETNKSTVIGFAKISGQENQGGKTEFTFTTDNTGLITLTIEATSPTSSITLSNIQLEEGTVTTPYEPYKSSILSCNDDVTLRGIGEVQDTLDCLRGELTEHISEIVLDGSENWVKYDNFVADNYSSFVATIPTLNNFYNNGTSFISGDFATCSWNYYVSNKASEVVWNHDPNKIGIRVKSERASNAEEIKAFLSTNNIRINYIIATESIKTVDLNVVDQDGNTIPKIKSYNDVTHLEVTIPKQSLLPYISAEVATDNSKDMSSLTTKHQEISEAQSAIENNIQSQSDEIDTALMATTEIFESILE